MSQRKPKKIPYVIYHYCSLDTFNAIITNKTLRLSDITKSNDSKELIYISDLIEDIFMAAYKAENAKYFKNAVSAELWRERVSHYVADWFDEKYRYYSCYVMCFSGKKDLLSQWRGYANDGKGVSIGFDSRSLKQLITGRDDLLSLNTVEYDKRAQQAQIRSIADTSIKVIKKGLKGGKQGVDSIDKIFSESFVKLFDLAAKCKNKFFSEEGEYRICYRVDKMSLASGNPDESRLNDYAAFKPFRFFTRDNIVSSYTDLCFKNAVEKNIHLIRSVTTGPKCNVSPEEIRLLLMQNGFELHYNDGGINVQPSVGSYR